MLWIKTFLGNPVLYTLRTGVNLKKIPNLPREKFHCHIQKQATWPSLLRKQLYLPLTRQLN